MKVTKFVHSCILVETPERTALFDPGVMSEQALQSLQLNKLDDICVTHEHPDHMSLTAIKKFATAFPDVRITSTPEVVAMLAKEGIAASIDPPEGVSLFTSQHEAGRALFNTPNQTGFHYLDQFTHPGDSHHFQETKSILALPITAPWGAVTNAVELALQLKPQYVLPIHDWHWSDEARRQMYDRLEPIFAAQNITFVKLKTGVPVELTIA